MTENWEFRNGKIKYPISFPFKQGHAITGTSRELKFRGPMAGPQLSRCSGPRNTRQGELVRILVTHSNLFDK